MGMTISIALILINCIISFTSFGNEKRLGELSMWPYMVKQKNQYYRFITSGFVHTDIQHLLFNMITLYFFGRVIEDAFDYLFNSKIYYLLFYFLALIMSDVRTYFKHKDNYYYQAIGASGAISAIVFCYILLDPWGTIGVFFIPMPAVIYGALYLGFTIYMARRSEQTHVSHDAHLWGAVFGLVFPLLFHPDLGLRFIDLLLAGPRR